MNFGAVLRSAYFLGVDRVCAVRENRYGDLFVCKTIGGNLHAIKINVFLFSNFLIPCTEVLPAIGI